MSKMDVEAARALAIAEALSASGARSLTELLDDRERHKEHLDRLCAKPEALPKVVKKRRVASSGLRMAANSSNKLARLSLVQHRARS